MCDLAEAQEALRVALRRLYEADAHLLEYDVNERSITHLLALYLRERFHGDWDVDCEYNRNGADAKRLPIAPVPVESDDTTGKTVYPDIIVHHRGRKGEGENLLVVEAKKAWAGGDADEDRRKLAAFGQSEDFSYALGSLVLLGHDGVEIEWYENGLLCSTEHMTNLTDAEVAR